MEAWKFGLAVATTVFVCGLTGLSLQRVLPERHTTGPAAEMIGAVVGLLSLLSALVLGLLIWTAYGVYAGQNVAIQGLAAKILQLDLALTDYGADAAGGRALLRQDLAKTVDEVWGKSERDQEFVAGNLGEAIANLHRREAYLETLTPATDAQRAASAAAQATVEAIAQTRLQMSFALADPISYPLLMTVVIWAACLFFGFGLKSRLGAASVVTLVVGSLAVASAAYTIVDLSTPYSGIFRTSPAPLQQVLAHMGQGQGAVGAHR